VELACRGGEEFNGTGRHSRGRIRRREDRAVTAGGQYLFLAWQVTHRDILLEYGAYQVLGVGDEATGATMGVDAMQALFLAMRGTDSILNPWRDALRRFDLRHEDPAQFPNVLDAGR